MLRLANEALVYLKNNDRELAIAQAVKKKKDDEKTKVCPNVDCGIRYKKELRKCPTCDKFYEKHLNEIGHAEEKEDWCGQSDDWSPDKYYKHLPSLQLPNDISTEVLDPLLSNPNSKINILALLHHIKESANIDGTLALPSDVTFEDILIREEKRQWTFVACDALIALQV